MLGAPGEANSPSTAASIDLFVSCAPADALFLAELEKSLALSRRKGVIRTMHRGVLSPGAVRDEMIARQIDAARIVVLLLSSDFFSSDDCHEVEMKRAIARHDEGVARVVPVLVRACDLALAPFAGLQALPRNGVPIAQWSHPDDAWAQVAREIRTMASALLGVTEPASLPEPQPAEGKTVGPREPTTTISPVQGPASSVKGMRSLVAALRVLAIALCVALISLAARQFAIANASGDIPSGGGSSSPSTADVAAAPSNSSTEAPATGDPSAPLATASATSGASAISSRSGGAARPTSTASSSAVNTGPAASGSPTAIVDETPPTPAGTGTTSGKHRRCFDATHCY